MVAALTLSACSPKGTLENSHEELVRVEGRQYEVRIAKTDMPDTWRLMVVRASVVLDAEPELERMRGQNVARPFIEHTCLQGPSLPPDHGQAAGRGELLHALSSAARRHE